MIDKIIFKLKKSLKLDTLLWRIEQNQLLVKKERLRDGRFYRKIFDQEKNYLHVREPFADELLTIMIKPAAFSSSSSCINFLKRLFTKDELFNTKVMRLDLAVDLNQPIKDVIAGLDIPRKQKIDLHLANDRYTGLTLGKKPEVFVAYDKNEEQKKRRSPDIICCEDITRLELRLFYPKISFRNVYEVFDKITEWLENNKTKIESNHVICRAIDQLS